MASVDWMKLKAGDMRKLAGHYQQELREKLNHSNKHINPEMTKNMATTMLPTFSYFNIFEIISTFIPL